MKYHVAVKFLAIILCAVCLLGAVGSAAGVVVLSEMDLYNKTVDEVLESDMQSSARGFAREAALYYASVELGGCPEKLVSKHYTNQWNNPFYVAGDYGYAIRDGEGNVIAGSNTELAESAKRYAFPVSGQYMHLVSETPESQSENAEQEYMENMSETPLNGEYGEFDAVPASGAVEVYNISIGYENDVGEVVGEGFGSVESIGLLYHDDSGVVFRSTEYNGLEGLTLQGEVTYIAFRNEEGHVVYEAAATTAVGEFYTYADGYMGFTSHMNGEVPSGTEPSDKITSVYLAEFYSMEDPEQTAFLVHGEDAIGEMHYDGNGNLVVNLQSIVSGNVKTSGAITEGWMSGVSLYDSNGALILDSRDTGVVTISEDGMLYYHTAPFERASVSALPEEPAEAPDQGEEPGEPEGEPGAEPEGEPEALTEPEQEDPKTADEAERGGEKAPEEDSAPNEETAGDDGKAEDVPEETQEETEAVVVETTVPATMPEDVTEPVAAAAYSVGGTEATEPVLINGKPLSEYELNKGRYYDSEAEEGMNVQYVYVPLPDYTVEVYVNEGAMRYDAAYTLLRIVRNVRSDLFLILGGSLLLFAVCAVYLCCAAGRKPKTAEIEAGGLCRMPLDLNAGLSILVFIGFVVVLDYSAERLLMASIEAGCMAMGGMAFLVSLTLVQLLYCAVAQFKTPGGYWWRNSICGRLLIGCWKLLKWMAAFLPGKVVRAVKWLWKLGTGILRFLWQGVILKALHGIGGLIRRFVGLLPLVWQWLLVGFLMVFIMCITANSGGIFFGIAVCLGIVLYVAYCFGVLMQSAKRMSKGDLNTKVNNKRLVGCFQEFAGDLNDLADVAVVAAQKQLKSERMKTELITNVSHDINTPLTSIINYVDLLQKPHTEEEENMYLEVLARQSQRLKKLIEDLMDMSKASTGNMNVDITTLDAVEAVNQALGEFGDKLEKAELIPVFRHTEPSVMMQGDGRLVWRVLSNLLSNAVKYAMPGTRLYIDLMAVEGKVVISLKNISREELNVDADELMERFVRGDDSRNTEGSGLGLNIAKSLMELQKGQLQLLVDGDLFKVTLIFPGE